MQFLNVLHRNFYTTSLFLARDIVKGEDDPDKKILSRLEYIRLNTCEELEVPLSTVEAYYIANWIALSRSVELRTNMGDIIELPVYKLKFYLDKAYIELRDIVRTVAIKYSIDIPFKGSESGTIEIG
jgi:hypothetical protein